MYLQKIILANFRGYEHGVFEFNSKFNVLIGDNATGKTALLDAISIGLSTFYKGLDIHSTKRFKKDDIRRKTFAENVEPQLPVEVSLKAKFKDQEIMWARRQDLFKGSTKIVGGDALLSISKKLSSAVREGEQVDLPIFSYYGTGRLWKDRSITENLPSKSSRLEGYKNALESFSNSKFFLQWMKKREIAALQKRIDTTSLNVVKAVISSFLDMNEKIYYDIIEGTIVMENLTTENNRVVLTWEMLSDGYRNVIGMAADLAFRCVTLNPHLGETAATNAKGVVLIDELDLHLHPNWQKRIVNNFKRAFPNIQFITSTHSPFIVQSLKNDELIDLQGKNLDTDYFRKSIEEISGEEMGVEHVQRSQLFEEMETVASKYFRLIREGKEESTLAHLRSRLDALQEIYSEDPAFVALLKAERDKANV